MSEELDPRLDPELLAEGDRRNVMDHYRGWRVEAIVADLDAKLEPARADSPALEVAIENLGHDFNIGSIIRTANGLGVRHVHIVGRRRFNRRGAMVTDRYLHVHHQPTPADLIAYARERGLTLVGIDNLPGAKALERAQLPARTLLVFGEESQGISPELWEACEMRVMISQFGSTRSLNVGAAAAIAMWAWRRVQMPEG